MTHTTRFRFLVFLVTLAAIGGLVFVLLGGVGPTQGITITTEGAPVVGSNFRFLLTVRATDLPASSGAYLSLGGINGTFDASASEAKGHPWGRANVWNLTGLDLSFGRSFILNATPVWAADIPLQAAVWTTTHGFDAVRFINGDTVDSSTVSVEHLARMSLTTTWPLTASVASDAPLVVGQSTRLYVSVHGSNAGLPTSQPVYLSVVTKPTYYTLAANGSSGNPWNATTLWNITGADLSQGIRVSLSITPTLAAKGVGMDVIVWSPRGSWSEVQLDGDGAILTLETVRLWVDTTFTFSVMSA